MRRTKKRVRELSSGGPRTITISAACKDLFDATIRAGSTEYDIDGYVPYGLGIGGGDSVDMTIDLQTGQILNWTPPTDQALLAVINDDEDEEYDDDEDDADLDPHEIES